MEQEVQEKKFMGWRYVAMGAATLFWGLIPPLAKDAMREDFTGMDMVTFRVTGAAICFWLTSVILSLCGKKQEHVPLRDVGLFFLASLLGITFNQSLYTIGISMTSPINASIMTTTMPIISFILSAILLKEKVSWQKLLGIGLALSGALMVILTSHTATAGGGDVVGESIGALLCVCAQCSFASYLVIFGKLVRKYTVVTCMKWMMLFASLTILPFSCWHLAELRWATIPLKSYLEAGAVVFFGTYCAYILMTWAQQALRPTQVAIFNYFQPIVACLVSVVMGLAVFGWYQAAAIVLVFSGVYIVTHVKQH